VDPTLLVAFVAALVSLLLVGATMVLAAGLVLVVWRSRRARARARRVVEPRPPPELDSLAPASDPVGAAAAAGGTAPAAPSGGLLGFFDDESSATGGDKRGGLFPPRRGWAEDTGDEGEATEIFSAHGVAADLAEFALDEADESTGRFSKSGEPR
jgi:hypothetical protein